MPKSKAQTKKTVRVPTGAVKDSVTTRTLEKSILEAAGFANVRCTTHDLLPEVADDSLIDDAQLNT